jgi:hypothetical protein
MGKTKRACKTGELEVDCIYICDEKIHAPVAVLVGIQIQVLRP